jgi:hypothetical protein
MNVEKILSAIDELMFARAVIEASSINDSDAKFREKIEAHVAAISKLELVRKEARQSQLDLAYYAAPVEKPANMRRGLMNAVQMAINVAAQGDVRECVLQLVNLLDDLGSNSNPYRIEGKV